MVWGAPQVKRASPRIKWGAPQMKRVSPQTILGAPQTVWATPQMAGVAPQLVRGAPQTKRGAPSFVKIGRFLAEFIDFCRRPLKWGEFRYNDPNARWGSPSYMLEPGDEGYVPPISPSNSKPKTKRKNMKHNIYYPSRQGDQIIWLTNFLNKIGGYTTILGLSAEQVTAAKADANWLLYVLQIWLAAVRTWAMGATSTANDAQTGDGSAAMTLPVFAAPALPDGTSAVAPGALNRIFTLVQQIKDSGKCTDAIAHDLGIVGSEQTAPDLTAVQPVITATIGGASKVNVGWGWQGNVAFLDACEIWVDRGDGKGRVFLTIDTTPGYTDTQPVPATPQKWSYTAIYRLNDGQTGLWSLPVSVTVGA
jgi:hypothetical protein